MAIDPVNFWSNKAYSKPNYKQQYFWERNDIDAKYVLARKLLAKMTPTDEFRQEGLDPPKILSLKDFLALKKDMAKSEIVAGESSNSDEEQTSSESKVYPSVSGLTEEDQEMLAQFQNEIPKKYLEMYFDAYMAPVHSDIQWRLGNVTGTIMKTEDFDDPTGNIAPDGRIYTRSNMHLSFNVPQLVGGRIIHQQIYYSNLYFPPYKMGPFNPLQYKTNLMPEILVDTPDATFNQDEFTIKRDGYTYRDPGFKAINDNIIFLQWLMEQATGVVSTYLTEWDLSVYMQEGMISPAPNGGPLRLYLNYRVRNDNPLADLTTGYNGNKALSFSVVNSAVSKLDFDCQKTWRPSDFPLSTFWLPYQKDVDWTLNVERIVDPVTEESEPVFYGSWANEKMMFDFEGSEIKDILRHQDFIGMALGAWPSTDMNYYQAIYYTDSDAFADIEIWHQSWLKKVAGAPVGESTANGKNLQHWLLKSRMDTIANGGVNGTMTAAGQGSVGGGSKNSRSLKKVMDKVASGFDEDQAAGDEKANEMKQAKAGAGSNLSESLTSGPMSGSGGKVDASTMSNLNGVNRFSPALFGGPHGANFSPHSVQAFFEENNQFLRNTPRLSMNDAKGFTSTSVIDLFDGVNKWYQNKEATGISPTKALSFLNNGIQNYTIDFMYEEYQVTEMVKGEVKFTPTGGYYFDFPKTINGKNVSYIGKPILKSKTAFQPFTIWGSNSITDRLRYWTQFYSYWNIFNIRRGPIYRNNQWGYDTTTYEVYKYAIYKKTRVRPYKKYLLHDEPDIRWKIYQHKFLQFTSDNTKDNPLWQLMAGSKGDRVLRKSPKYKAQIEGQNTVFVLKFDNDEIERKFIDNMIKQGREYSRNQQVPLIFLEGNERQRYKFGPSSIFTAYCSVDYYKSVYKMPKRESFIPGFRGYNFSKFVENWSSSNHEEPKRSWAELILKSIFSKLLQMSSNPRRVHTDYDIKFMNVPYIKVDILGNIPFFADKVNTDGYSNRTKGTVGTAIELDSIPQDNDYIEHADDILQKFKVMGYNKMGSYIFEKKYANIKRSMITEGALSYNFKNMIYGVPEEEGSSPGWYSLVPLMTNQESITLNNGQLVYEIDLYRFVKPGDPFIDAPPGVGGGSEVWDRFYQIKGKPYPIPIYNEQGSIAGYDDPLKGNKQGTNAFGKGVPQVAWSPNYDRGEPLQQVYSYPSRNTYKNPGYIVHRQEGDGRDINVPPDWWQGPEELDKKIIWESKAIMGISGIGILSQIQAIDPSSIDVGFTVLGNYPSNVNYKELLTVDQKTLSSPISTMGYKTHFYIDSASERHSSIEGIVSYVPGGIPTYGEKDMDIGLKYALSGIGTKSTFYKEEQPDKEYMINLDVPFRVFYNLVQRQLTFLKVIKENFIDTVDFEIMRRFLLECVDKCVAKASGITVDGLYQKDVTHVLYNYWINCAVGFFGDPETHIANKQKIVDIINTKIYKYEWCIQVMDEYITKKNIRDWSWAAIKNTFKAIAQIGEEMKISDMDRYMFAYLNCLYYYRLFFVGKRFNKEDGTMWVMRALESCLDLIAPYPSDNNPPSIAKLATKDNAYTVAFYELQNTSEMKKNAILTSTPLEEDKIKTAYVKVKWATKKDFDAWNLYLKNTRKNKRVPQVVEIEKKSKGKTIIKYAELPINGVYTLISQELLDDQKNIKFNNTHPKSPQRWTRNDIDYVEFQINWGDRVDLTPIKWNIFNNVLVDKVLQYSTDSVTPEELLCLAKDGADYWTVSIPKELWPRATAYKTKLKLKHYDPLKKTTHLQNDPLITIMGSSSYNIYPITESQERPFPGVGSPDSLKSLKPAGF